MQPAPFFSPADLADKPLFEPLADWLQRFPAPGFPSTEELNALSAMAGLRTADGRLLRFVAPPDDGLGYEARIAVSGQVEHRQDNGHDFFNALVWLAFPRAKAALSARHASALAERVGQSGRGAVRDALTQFDECGVAVISADPAISELLRNHEWKQAFWCRRNELQARMRFIVFGHALYDQLHSPFFGLCGKAVYLDVGADWLERDGGWQRQDLDQRLAAWIGNSLNSPRDLKPLPLLGIPGVVSGNGVEGYYEDERQFRPRFRPELPGA